MSQFSNDLEIILSPTRDLYLSRYFRRLAKWRKIGYQVRPEAKVRDVNGVIVRDGVLNLPRRADFGLVGPNGAEYRDVAAICDMIFEPMEFSLSRKASIKVNPFSWKAFMVSFDADDDPVRLQLVRQWYLEAFQSRRLDEGPDVLGVLHSLRGPQFVENTWSIEIDMGSAPISAFAGLLDVLVGSGVTEISVDADAEFIAADSN